VFSFHLTRGDVSTALSEPFSIVLTKTAAKKYFGDSDPLGQVLTINMYDSAGLGAQYKVTGIMPDAPKNSHFTFNMLASFKTVEVANPDVLTVDGWGDASFYTYLLLKKLIINFQKRSHSFMESILANGMMSGSQFIFINCNLLPIFI
jgi:putative ABC transport system permease protein